LTSSNFHLQPYSPNGPTTFAHEPLPPVQGDAWECHFCENILGDADKQLFYQNQEQWHQGRELDDLWQWVANAQVVPVCETCRDGLGATYELPGTQAIANFGTLFFRFLTAVFLLISLMTLCKAIVR
jgi:hypothetical protein